jgi:hypothetical protein
MHEYVEVAPLALQAFEGGVDLRVDRDVKRQRQGR